MEGLEVGKDETRSYLVKNTTGCKVQLAICARPLWLLERQERMMNWLTSACVMSRIC